MEGAAHAKPDRNLALELVRVTEAAALASARWVGRGDKIAADQAAVDAMRFVLDSVAMDGVVVIGEGEKDEAPMLYNGERIGDGSAPVVDIAVDPLEGTRLCALGMPSALAVIALAERGTMFDPGPCVYMEKMAGGEEIADLLDLDRPLPETLKLIAERKGGTVGDVTVVMLDRPRHEEAMKEVREAGGRIRLITDGDVSAALLAVSDRSPVDLLWGIGGTPEGVLSAAALKSMGGQLLGRLWPRDDGERQAAIDAGYDLDRVLTGDDLCSGEDVFFSASGVTDGDVLQGVRYRGPGATTESLVMRSRSGTVRRIQATPRPLEAAGDHRRALRLRPRRLSRTPCIPRPLGFLRPLLLRLGRRRVGHLAGVVELVAEAVDHGAGHQREAQRVEPEQGDQDEAERRAEPGEAGDVGEVERERPVGGAGGDRDEERARARPPATACALSAPPRRSRRGSRR